jgi:hypothetical protein
MWKYGDALQQRPEDRSLNGRGATIKTMHPEPSLKPFWGLLNRESGVKPSTINQQFQSVQVI